MEKKRKKRQVKAIKINIARRTVIVDDKLAFYKKKPIGSFGDISTFSFYANKHITTGEGGMVVTNNKSLAVYFKSLVMCDDSTSNIALSKWSDIHSKNSLFLKTNL